MSRSVIRVFIGPIVEEELTTKYPDPSTDERRTGGGNSTPGAFAWSGYREGTGALMTKIACPTWHTPTGQKLNPKKWLAQGAPTFQDLQASAPNPPLLESSPTPPTPSLPVDPRPPINPSIFTKLKSILKHSPSRHDPRPTTQLKLPISPILSKLCSFCPRAHSLGYEWAVRHLL
ncbi:hypothetical protein BS17DRAFT_815841 [Gyrodon lividus]|nr:hypothetical protein BS17DRAFT_815841 [Gyrodon lividus]